MSSCDFKKLHFCKKFPQEYNFLQDYSSFWDSGSDVCIPLSVLFEFNLQDFNRALRIGQCFCMKLTNEVRSCIETFQIQHCEQEGDVD